jgi:hypothetical protein
MTAAEFRKLIECCKKALPFSEKPRHVGQSMSCPDCSRIWFGAMLNGGKLTWLTETAAVEKPQPDGSEKQSEAKP